MLIIQYVFLSEHVFPQVRYIFYVDSMINIPTMMSERHGVIIPPTNGWSSREGCFIFAGNEGIPVGTYY